MRRAGFDIRSLVLQAAAAVAALHHSPGMREDATKLLRLANEHPGVVLPCSSELLIAYRQTLQAISRTPTPGMTNAPTP